MASLATTASASTTATNKETTEFLPQDPEGSVETLRRQGNELFVKGKYNKADLKYTQAIELGIDDPKLYGNRSAARHHMERYEEALTDAMRALELDPSWTKGYHRKAMALISLGQLEDAAKAYEDALALDPENGGLQKKLDSARRRVADAVKRSKIRGLKHWLSIFTTQSDVRLRLGVMASFWNEANKSERLQIFYRFLSIIGGVSATDDQLELLKANFTEDRMTDLPLDNYSDLEIPEHWIIYFRELHPDNKGEYFEAMFKSLHESEKTLVINDLKYFYQYQSDDTGDETERSGGN
jgi:tetratricopeptide (TPR) repeat protein